MKDQKYIPIALMLGGNLGNLPAAFRQAMERLREAGLTDLRISSFHRTAPVDCPPGSPDFLDAALTARTVLAPRELLALCKRLEREAGRPEVYERNSPRPLDLDIILYGDLVYQDDFLQIPHPRAAERRFVLDPLAEIAPDWRFPDSGRTVAELRAQL